MGASLSTQRVSLQIQGTHGLVGFKGRPRCRLPESCAAAGVRPAQPRVAPPPCRRTRPAPAPPRVNPSPPGAGSGRRPPRGWSCRVSSRDRPGRRPACLQALGLAAAATQARPPARPFPRPRAALTRSSRGRAGPSVGWGGGGDCGRARGPATAAGPGRRRGGAGLGPGPRLSEPSRLRSSGRRSGR